MGLPVSITSPATVATLALIVTALRHARHRSPSLFECARSFRPPALPPGAVETGPVWAVSRLTVIGVGALAVATIGFPNVPPRGPWDSTFLNLPARWDAMWYLDVAANGYRWGGLPTEQENVAFFPAFPLTMRAGGALLGAYASGLDKRTVEQRLLLGGWLVAVGTFWWALAYIYRWSAARAGPAAARATTTLLATYPFAVFYSAPYSEPLFLLAGVAAFFHFERAEWRRAAFWGFIVGLARPGGVLMTLPLAIIAARPRTGTARLSWPPPGAWVALSAPAAALALHMFHLRQVSGRWFAWAEVQVAWGRTYDLAAWAQIELAHLAEVGPLRYAAAGPVTMMNGMAAIMALVLLWRVTTRVGLPYTLLVLVNIVPAVASGGLLSVGRFTSSLFPLFHALAVSIPDRQLPAWVLGFAVGQGLLAVLFFTWRPPV